MSPEGIPQDALEDVLEDKQRIMIFSRTNILSLAILLLSTLGLAWWFYERSQYIHVSDARIAATMVSLSSRIPGWIVNFPIDEGDTVKVGDILLQIDPREANARLDELDAKLRTIAAEYARLQSKLALTEQQLISKTVGEQSHFAAATSASSEAKVELSKAWREFERVKSLLRQKVISIEDYDSRKSELDRVDQAHKRKIAEAEMAKANLLLSEVNKAELGVINQEMKIITSREEELRVQKQRLTSTMEDHMIKSPIVGIVDETFANNGEYVYPGQRILMLHDPDKLWIKANVKETDIRYLHPGSIVHISIDAYPGEKLKGKVSTIGHSATSQFALLPSPNPSGNFIKITQRIEVKVAFDANKLPLHPGMMVELKFQIDDE